MTLLPREHPLSFPKASKCAFFDPWPEHHFLSAVSSDLPGAPPGALLHLPSWCCTDGTRGRALRPLDDVAGYSSFRRISAHSEEASSASIPEWFPPSLSIHLTDLSYPGSGKQGKGVL